MFFNYKESICGAKLFGRYFISAAFALMVIAGVAASADAATFTVTNLDDSGAGSLRQAIIDANNLAGDDTIVFQDPLSGTIGLTSGELLISSNISINAPVSNSLTVRRTAKVSKFRIFNINFGANVTISNLTISGGFVAATSSGLFAGGGVFNAGTLNLINVIVNGNRADAGPMNTTTISGGGIYNRGTLSMTGGEVSDNTSKGSFRGDGGGITNSDQGSLTLTNTKILRNVAMSNTGGVGNSSCGCGGGIENAGSAILTNVNVSGNSGSGRWSWGGGIDNPSTELTMTNSSVSNNTATGTNNGEARGGGIHSGGILNLTNTTIANNTATQASTNRGGGLYILGTAFLKSVTVAFNTISGTFSPREGGGIYASSNTNLYNTIVAGNAALPVNNSSGLDVYNSVISQGNNLIGDTTGSSGWNGTDLINQPARLAPLDNYGGPTPTVALLPDSPAINAGNNTNAPPTDQRGAARIVEGTIDIGAFENNIQISPATLPDGVLGEPYNQMLSAVRLSSIAGESFVDSKQNLFNELPPFSFDLVGFTSLPPGLTLSQSGDISGTPTAGGTYNVTVRAVDSDGLAGARAYSINIPCSYSLGSNGQTISSAGGTGSFTVTATPGCVWTAQSNDSWISVTNGSSGSGNGTVEFSVEFNSIAQRVGTITAAGLTFTITQTSGCDYALSSSSTNMPVGGGSGSFNVNTPVGCPWTAAANDSWINITSGSSGDGGGTVSFSVQANTGVARTGTITAGGQTYTVNQAPSCSYSLSSAGTNFPASGGSGSFNVTVFNGCSWSATPSASWITINSGSGDGNGSVTYTVQPNVQPARSGTITVGSQTFTIEQPSGCNFTLTSTSANIPASGGAGGFTVNSGGGCAWTADSNAAWISVTSGGAGSGSGNVTFSVQANNGHARTGTITAGGQTFTINQAAASSFRTPFDFDGDGKTDISIFRPSNGEWWYQRSIDGGSYAAQFGNSSDKVMPGDFTGDGKADIAIWRPSTGEWFILRSEDGSYYSFPFGTSGDIPTVGDFDSDGKADQAVFRPSDTNWYIRRSSDGGFTIQQFGLNGDVPAVADYDGDGKSDIAIWRASTGEWWIQKSSNNSVVAFQFGISSDKTVQGDYTGDGKADVAIWRPSTGEWFILRSEDGTYYSHPFGTNGDIPAPGDYDNDGKFDATVFRPSGSTWYVQRTTAGTLIQQFGLSSDKPVPNAFVP